MTLRYQIVGSAGANRRRDRRYEIPSIEVALDRVMFTTANWSLGGVLLSGYRGRRRAGERVTIRLIARDEDTVYQHDAEAEVVRVAPKPGEIALHFTDLDWPAFDTLEGLITGSLRRKRRDPPA